MFDVVYRVNDVRYAYGFSLDNEKILSEYLYSYPRGSKRTIFERNINDVPFYVPYDKRRQKQIAENTLDNTLYLSKATQANYVPAVNAFEGLNRIVSFVSSPQQTLDVLSQYTAANMKDNEDEKEKVLSFFRNIDISINDFSFKPIKTSGIEGGLGDEVFVISHYKGTGLEGEETTIKMPFFHSESNGTIKFFSLIGPWIDVLEMGLVLVYDELEARLHPMLTRFLVSLFHNPETNPKNAQLIFNTHDIHLLDSEMFRRDQVWFTERRGDGSTDLYSLLDFKSRKNENFRNNYLFGRYGAIPIINEG